jgi:competence protein ComEC
MRPLYGLLFLVVACAAPLAAAPTLDVYFINVGRGDAILIDCGDWEALIDAGRGYPETDAEVLATLEKCVNDGTIEVAILSHLHADHYGGFFSVFQRYEVLEFWSSNDSSPDTCGETYGAFMTALTGGRLDREKLECGDQRRTGCLLWTVLSPSTMRATPVDENDNANSLVLLLQYGAVSFLFPGDVQADSEPTFSAQTDPETGSVAVALPDTQLVLTMPHHGRDSSTSSSLLAWADPELAIVSGIAGDLSPTVVSNLGRRNVPFLTTFDNGTIRVSTDGIAVWVRAIGAPTDRAS